MAYTKQYSKTTWQNNQAPAINATNLNKIEDGIDNVDSGLVEVEQSLTVRMDELEDDVAAEVTARADADTAINNKIGNLANLGTDDKTTLVGAINEVNEKSDQTELERQVLAAFPTNTISGSIVAVDDGADNIPVKSLTVNIEPYQSGSGDPSPTNVRAITGWNGINVFRTGKNLLDQSKCTAKKYIYNNGATGDSSDWSVSDYIPIKGGEEYTFSGYEATGWVACHAFYDANKGFISYVYAIDHNTFTAPSNAAFVRLSIKTETPTVAQLELGTTATAYEPYSGATYNISMSSAGTVYGGTLNVETGVLTVNRVLLTLNGTNYPIGARSSSASGTVLIQAIVTPRVATVDEHDATKIVSDYLPSLSDYSIYRSANIGVALHTPQTVTERRIWMRLPEITTEEAAKTYLAAHPLTVAYQIETAQTYQLTAQEVTTLLNNNTIFADCGNVTLTYRADPTAYINNVISALS